MKYRIRDTVEAVVGAVTGSLQQPESLVLGYYNAAGTLMVAGSTTPLTRLQQHQVAAQLRPAPGGHPWPDRIGSGRLGHWGGPPRAVTRVDATLVVEISADTAVTAGAWRLVTRFIGSGRTSTPRRSPDRPDGRLPPSLPVPRAG